MGSKTKTRSDAFRAYGEAERGERGGKISEDVAKMVVARQDRRDAEKRYQDALAVWRVRWALTLRARRKGKVAVLPDSPHRDSEARPRPPAGGPAPHNRDGGRWRLYPVGAKPDGVGYRDCAGDPISTQLAEFFAKKFTAG